jgi:phage gpG-like protein
MIELGIERTGTIDAVLSKLELALDSTLILDEAGALLLNRIRTRFLAETSTDGSKWLPSKAAIKRRANGGTGTLFQTGRLFRSIQLSGSGADQREISTDVPYAAYHNFGLGQVKREFIGASAEDGLLIERLVMLRVSEALK